MSPFSDVASAPTSVDPLASLSADEIEVACAIAREGHRLGERPRIVMVSLEEPTRPEMSQYNSGGGAIERRARIVAIDQKSGHRSEGLVSLTRAAVDEWQDDADPAIDGQPAVIVDEFDEVEAIVKADRRWVEAVKRRGVANIDLVQIDPFSAGNFGFDDEKGRRLIRAVAYERHHDRDNAYAHPIDGLVAYVDVIDKSVMRVVDSGVVPIPHECANFTDDAIPGFRADLKPLRISQPDGPSFVVHGNEVQWQKWRFRVSMTPREGLVIHTASYDDGGRNRDIFYRAAVSEMVVPYGDPRASFFWRSAFDVGEYGLGVLANSLILGCDCLGHIHYFDAHMATSSGKAMTIRNAICMHEEDYGVLWRHSDIRYGGSWVRRSRRLVVSFFTTVGNYDYGFYWYFYQDGTIQLEVKLTGIVQTTYLGPGEKSSHNNRIAGELGAAHHQHFFCVRLDMTVDGPRNSVAEVEAVPVDGPADNPYGNSFVMRSRTLTSERQAQRCARAEVGRYWNIFNPQRHNAFGDAVGYKLVPQAGPTLLAQQTSAVWARAAFATKHLWVTRYDPSQRYPAGNHPNQHPGGAGLPQWVAADRTVENEEIVVWHTFGITHFARPEDWPVMPVEYVGFTLKPNGFFDANPALDVPTPEASDPPT